MARKLTESQQDLFDRAWAAIVAPPAAPGTPRVLQPVELKTPQAKRALTHWESDGKPLELVAKAARELGVLQAITRSDVLELAVRQSVTSGEYSFRMRRRGRGQDIGNAVDSPAWSIALHNRLVDHFTGKFPGQQSDPSKWAYDRYLKAVEEKQNQLSTPGWPEWELKRLSGEKKPDEWVVQPDYFIKQVPEATSVVEIAAMAGWLGIGREVATSVARSKNHPWAWEYFKSQPANWDLKWPPSFYQRVAEEGFMVPNEHQHGGRYYNWVHILQEMEARPTSEIPADFWAALAKSTRLTDRVAAWRQLDLRGWKIVVHRPTPKKEG